ncbi:MAG TPA: nicotinate-nucleotide adenylyltransferase [Bacteroidota bacterium]|nr:nicotinate-nucleotide adenylyltransferase [Bacteroidota bacterium]
MKLGIFGGTFDPVHHGHLIVAEAVRESVGLDRIMFVPTLISPHKQDVPATPAGQRLEMLREAVKPNPFFEVLDIEIERGGVSYTVDTIRALEETHTHDEFYLLIGADNLLDFGAWREPSEILRRVVLVVMGRPGFPAAAREPQLPERTIRCRVPAIDISGTDIRRRVKEGLPISYLVPPAVARFIGRHRLYI